MVLEVLDKSGAKVSEIELNSEIYGTKVNDALFYEVVKMQLANRRSGTACTKTKGEVSGGGAKPWKQKGTGRARSGSSRSPLWRHGGTVFGPKPRDYSYKMPKKAVKQALKSALLLKLNDGSLKVYDSIELGAPKTKEALEFINKSNLKKALFVIDGDNNNLRLAVRNLKGFKYIDVKGINVYDILNYDELVMTRGAFEKVEAML